MCEFLSEEISSTKLDLLPGSTVAINFIHGLHHRYSFGRTRWRTGACSFLRRGKIWILWMTLKWWERKRCIEFTSNHRKVGGLTMCSLFARHNCLYLCLSFMSPPAFHFAACKVHLHPKSLAPKRAFLNNSPGRKYPFNSPVQKIWKPLDFQRLRPQPPPKKPP